MPAHAVKALESGDRASLVLISARGAGTLAGIYPLFDSIRSKTSRFGDQYCLYNMVKESGKRVVLGPLYKGNLHQSLRKPSSGMKTCKNRQQN